MQDNQQKKKNQLNTYIKHSSLGLQMIVIITIGAFFGEYLDNKNNFNTPIFTICCSLGSIVLALYYVLRGVTNKNGKK